MLPRELLGLNVYAYGFSPLGPQSLVYAAIANREQCPSPTTGSASRIVEIGQSNDFPTPIARLLTGKQQNVEHMHRAGIDYVCYVELLRLDPAATNASSIEVENPLTRLFALALGAWPIGNSLSDDSKTKSQHKQAESNFNLYLKDAYAFCTGPHFKACSDLILSLGNSEFQRRWTAITDICSRWTGASPADGLPNPTDRIKGLIHGNTRVTGLRQYTEYLDRQGNATKAPLSLRAQLREVANGIQVVESVDPRLWVLPPSSPTPKPLAGQGDNLNLETAEEEHALDQIKQLCDLPATP